ncbi:MAG: ferredoxin [Candidatus Polarisedimenticolia bacterium]|nr:ferredoxin [bacterium]
MADRTNKQPENAPGKYYVDQNCSACQVCVSTAPDNFKMNDGEEHALVFKQPANAAEVSACEDAMSGCPEEAIGNDGE